MLWKKSAKRPVKTGDLTAFIDEGSDIEGKYTFTGTVMLNGKFRGEISSTDTLIVGEKGVIHASIHAGVVLVSGQVVGNVVAKERVELRGAARVIGDVEAPVMVLEEGVVFDGHCRMPQAQGTSESTTPTMASLPLATAPPRDLSVVSSVKR
jgi:cytoskeletal protein CcmA (bactofilin family)